MVYVSRPVLVPTGCWVGRRPGKHTALCMDAHWPIAAEAIFGMITLIDDDTINYSLPSGEVIAVYEPATADPALCA